MNSSSLALSSGADINVSSAGLSIIGEISYTQWTTLLSSLQNIKNAYHCSLADVLNYGKQHFPSEDVAAALEQLEFEMSDVLKAEAIGQLTLDFRERNQLTAEHYFVLSTCDAKDAKKWAETARKHNLSALELKRSIEANKLLRSSDIQSTSGQGSGINTIQGVIFRFKSWETSLGGREKILNLPKPERENLLELLRPTIELAAAVEESLSED